MQVGLKALFGGEAEGDEPLLVALADNPDKASGQIAAGNGQLHQLGDPQSGGVEQTEHRIITLDEGCYDRGRREESRHLFNRQGLGQGATAPRQVDGGKGVVKNMAASRKERKKGL